MNKQVSEYIEQAPGGQKEIMKAIRSLVHQHVSGVAEEFKWGRPIFRREKPFAYLQANKNHVNLGFYSGFEKLDDPDGLLEGTGKTMRHVKLRTLADVDSKRLGEWFAVVAGG